MTAQDIKLRNVIDDEVFPSSFYHGDTILDLKKRFAEELGYEDAYQKITFYGFCYVLPDALPGARHVISNEFIKPLLMKHNCTSLFQNGSRTRIGTIRSVLNTRKKTY